SPAPWPMASGRSGSRVTTSATSSRRRRHARRGESAGAVSLLRPPRYELVEGDGAVAVAVDLVEADLTLFRGDVLVRVLHEPDEFAERQPPVVVEVVEVEVFAQAAVLFGAGLHVVERGAVAIVFGHGGSPVSYE